MQFKVLKNYRNFKKLLDNIDPFFKHNVGPTIGGMQKREQFIEKLAEGKNVLHFGFLDAPLSEKRALAGELLHQRLANVADRLYGVDVDAQSLELYRSITNDRDNIIFNIAEMGSDFGKLADDFEVILFPEVLEHIQNPGITLANLKQLCMANNGASLCITVPSAFSMMGFTAAFEGMEIVHPDHYFYFSPVTLKKLLSDIGFKNIEISLYGADIETNLSGIMGSGLIAVCQA